MKNKLYGFTLAEGLIAMAIVGVIAALTIPGIVANYQTQSYLTGLKKAYADLQQNLSIMQADNYRIKRLNASMLARGYVGFGNTGKTIDETAGQFLKTYYKINRDCGTDTQPCFADAYGSIDGDGDENFSCSNGYSVLLPDSTAICIVPARTERLPNTCYPSGICLEVINTRFYPNATVYIDVNGPDLPNIGGRDMFTFNIYEDFSIDNISPVTIKYNDATAERNELFDNNCKTSTTGVGCFGKILNDNWQMNY